MDTLKQLSTLFFSRLSIKNLLRNSVINSLHTNLKPPFIQIIKVRQWRLDRFVNIMQKIPVQFTSYSLQKYLFLITFFLCFYNPYLLIAYQTNLVENESIFVKKSNTLSLLENHSFFRSNPSKTQIENFLDSYKVHPTLPSIEDAELLKAIYVQYGREINNKSKVKLLINLAYIYNRNFKSDAVIETLAELRRYELSEFELGLAHYYHGLAEQDRSNFEQALSKYLDAAPLFEKLNSTENLAAIYSDMGRLYNSTGDFDNSLTYYLKAIDAANTLNDVNLLAKFHSNVGTTYEKLDANDEAISSYNMGLELARFLNDSLKIAQNLMNIGNVYMKLNNHADAQKQYIESLAICEIKSISYGKLLNYMNMGENARMWGRWEMAQTMLDTALSLAENMSLPLEKSNILGNQAELYFETKKYNLAFTTLKEAKKLENEIFAKEKQSRIDELSVQYETSLKERDLERANLKLITSQQRNSFLIILTIMAVMISILIYTFYRYKNQKLKDLYLKNLETLRFYEKKKELLYIHKEETEKISPEGNSNFDALFDQINRVLILENSFKNEALSLSSLSELVKSNSKYVSQAIQQNTDKNFNAYINHLRVMEAKKLIKESYHKINLSEVLYSCGFKSRSTFYTAFQKETGMSPKQYRDLATSDFGHKIGKE